MNQGFKLRYDQMRDSDPTHTETDNQPAAGVDAYDAAGYVRNVCLCWLDGRKMFLNYAYLVACEYQPGDELNAIILGFSSHKVTLQGYWLEALFTNLLDHLPRYIRQVDPRYSQVEEIEISVVVSIEIAKTGE